MPAAESSFCLGVDADLFKPRILCHEWNSFGMPVQYQQYFGIFICLLSQKSNEMFVPRPWCFIYVNFVKEYALSEFMCCYSRMLFPHLHYKAGG